MKPWYSINPDLTTEQHDPITLEEAICIAGRYYLRANEKFETGEEAIAATMFGFGSPTEFIELCVNGPHQISYKFETPDETAPWFLKPWKGIFQSEKVLPDRESMEHRIHDFFSLPHEDILRRHKANQ